MDGAPTRRARSPTHHDTAFATRPSKHPRLHTGDAPDDSPESVKPHSPESQDILDALEEELTCGMCSGVFIEPVALDICGHVFCGSCITLWLKNRYGQELPLSCPQCRISPIGSASPSRLARTMVSLLVSRRPEACRALNERVQADQVYMSQRDGHINFPKSKPDTSSSSASFWQPCQNCYPADTTVSLDTPLSPSGTGAPEPMASAPMVTDYVRDVIDCRRAPVQQALCSRPGPHWEPLPAAVENANIEPLMLSFRDNWQELSDLALYLRARPDLTATEIFRNITSWVSSEAALSAGGVCGMLARADSVLASRAAYAAEMQQVFSPGPSGKDTAGLYEWWAREVVKPETLDKLPAAMRNRSHCDRGRTPNEPVSPGQQFGDKSPESSNVGSVDVGIQHGDSAFALGKATYDSGV
ncbi:hypothetical protein EHS25_003482 [Saitozyma podzolica]|uniref:RING-type domain-containing protein n=1 Tax=Saitozyma podzolica TaxID=1890683 RepID=A0A427Y7F5_9TREE|nr:hypothetical protein EHS25_003482 [Saitozyma podzolica]